MRSVSNAETVTDEHLCPKRPLRFRISYYLYKRDGRIEQEWWIAEEKVERDARAIYPIAHCPWCGDELPYEGKMVE